MNRPVRIAVIDDEPKLTKLLKLVLEEGLSCEVSVFNDSLHALDALKNEEFDVISLDHRMPHLTGTQIVKQLRTADGPNCKTPIVLLTAFREEAEHLKLELLKDLLFLDKPIEDEHYLVNIRIALQMKKNQLLRVG